MRFPELTAQFSVWKTTGKHSSEIIAIACQNCAVYSVFPSGMTTHSKIAQFNWECIWRFKENWDNYAENIMRLRTKYGPLGLLHPCSRELRMRKVSYVMYLILSYELIPFFKMQLKQRVRHDIVRKLHKGNTGFMKAPIKWIQEIWESQKGAEENFRLAGYDNVQIGIQGVTGGTDQTSGECSLGQTIPI